MWDAATIIHIPSPWVPPQLRSFRDTGNLGGDSIEGGSRRVYETRVKNSHGQHKTDLNPNKAGDVLQVV